MEELEKIPLVLWIVLGALLLAQASWIFFDASKREESKWLWGFFGLLNIPTNLVIYLVVTRVILNNSKCDDCGARIKDNFKYCPYCGRIKKNI